MMQIRLIMVSMIAGCGLAMTAGPARAADGKVNGIVTVNGEPLEHGKVIFHLADGQFVGSKVKDAKYAIDRVPTGTWKVTIEGEGVPDKYSRDDGTPLTAEVKDGGGRIDFGLRK